MGQLIEIIPKRQFDFDGRINTTQEIVLMDNVSTVGFATGALLVRVHSHSGIVTGASAKVVVYNQSRDPNDPGTFFVTTTQVAATSSITSSTTAGTLIVAEFSAPISSAVRVALQWTQGGTGATSAQRVVLAVDLVGRA